MEIYLPLVDFNFKCGQLSATLFPMIQLLTVREVADLLKVRTTRVYHLISTGQIPTVQLGERQLRIDAEALEAALRQSRRP